MQIYVRATENSEILDTYVAVPLLDTNVADEIGIYLAKVQSDFWPYAPLLLYVNYMACFISIIIQPDYITIETFLADVFAGIGIYSAKFIDPRNISPIFLNETYMYGAIHLLFLMYFTILPPVIPSWSYGWKMAYQAHVQWPLTASVYVNPSHQNSISITTEQS